MKKALFTVLACAALVGFVGLPMLQAVEAPADLTIKAPAISSLPAPLPGKPHASCRFKHRPEDPRIYWPSGHV